MKKILLPVIGLNYYPDDKDSNLDIRGCTLLTKEIVQLRMMNQRLADNTSKPLRPFIPSEYRKLLEEFKEYHSPKEFFVLDPNIRDLFIEPPALYIAASSVLRNVWVPQSWLESDK